MKILGIVCLLSLVGAGCKEPGQPGQSGPQGRPPAERPVCSTDADCAPDFSCTSRVCVAPDPTVASYHACSLDVDCPTGDHCDLGACTHDCVADRDCTAAGQTCDIRGRCATPATANLPPAPVPPTARAPVLAVAESQLDFADFANPKEITLRNVGAAALDFRILGNQSWLSADPATGTIPAGEEMPVTVSVQQIGTGTMGTVSIVSTGGTASVRISIPGSLSGLYQGEVHITGPSDLGTRTLAMAFAKDANGRLVGVVDDARSPAFGYRAALQLTMWNASALSARFVIPAHVGTGGNPSYPANLVRTVGIEGTIVAGGKLSGTYTETIEGALTNPVVLTGTIDLVPIDRAAAPLPSQTDQPAASSPAAPTFLRCDVCPSGACPSSHVAAGSDFLKAAFKFYKTALADGSHDAYAPIRGCIDNPSDCYNPIALHCAQMHFFTALQAGASPEAQRGLLDTLKGQLVWQSLSGNEQLVRAFVLEQTLDATIDKLVAARTAFSKGLFGDDTGGARVWGMLDPYFINWVASLPPTIWNNTRTSELPEQLKLPTDKSNDGPWSVAAFADFDRVAEGLRVWLEALRRELEAQHRFSAFDTADLVIQAGHDAADAHIALGLASTLLARMGGTGRLPDAVGKAGQLTEEIRRIRSGLNPAGYPDGFIAYTYNPANGPNSNNYRDLMKDFKDSWLSNAAGNFKAAEDVTRFFESSHHEIAKDLDAFNTASGQRIVELCGSSANRPSTTDCGATGGLVLDTVLQLTSAYRRLENADIAVRNAYTAIAIEEHRAAEVAGLHKATATLITANGQRLQVLEQKETDLETTSGLLSGIVGFVANVATNPGAAFTMYANSIIDAVVGDSKLAIEQERIRLATIENARFEFNAEREVTIDSEARVKTLALEIPTLMINALMAHDDIGRLMGQLRTQLQQAQDAESARKSTQQLLGQDPRRDPAFRLYRDQKTEDAAAAFNDAMSQLFLVTRALEYEIGMSFAGRADLFTLVNPAGMTSYAADLDATYQRYVAQVGNPQQRQMTLSLRDQIFRFPNALQDPATGGSYQPADVFHRLLAEPRNRDADGNVRLSFALSLAPDAFIFNNSLCTDKITGIRISLVGSALGATQPEVMLQQRGSAFLRSCTERDANGDYVVTEYNLENTIGVRRAIVQAGLNLSSPMDPSSGGPLDTEFYGRPIAAPFELIIDRKAPANANLDLTKLDDIVLFISHETRTVRQ